MNENNEKVNESNKNEEEEKKTGVEELDNKELRDFLSKKKKEEEISNKAYSLMEEASALAATNDFDSAINKYNQAKKFFEDIDWQYEAERILKTIKELEVEKESFLKRLAEERKEKEKQLELEKKHKQKLEEGAQKKDQAQKEERSAKLKEVEKQKRQKESFEQEISDLVDKAEKMARNYEISRKKKLKKGKFPDENPYPKVIEIYETVYKKLLEKGWKDQAEIYRNQIRIYNEKLEKDKKLREIEAKKAQKQKQVEELKKIQQPSIEQEEVKLEKLQKSQKQKTFEKEILDLVDQAELLARDYETELKKKIKEGKFPEKNPYSEIIEIYEKVYKMLMSKGWTDQADIYKNQIKIYREKLDKEETLRQIEADKVRKQKKIEDMHKIASGELEKDQVQEIENELQSELESKKLEEYVDKQVEKAERMAREYSSNLRRGNFEQDCPYPEIIQIYRDLRNRLQKHGWYEESALYANQIQFYKEKLEKDKKLRKIESQKFDDELVKEIKSEPRKKGKKHEEAFKELKEKEEREEFQTEISEMVDKAEKMARQYESELKKGKFEIENQYPEVIKIYRKIRKRLIDRGWLKEAEIYLNQIKIYKEKAQRVEKLKNVEAQKAERDKKIEDMHKIHRPIEKISKTIDEKEEKIKEEKEEKLNKAMSIIDEAERLVKGYESKLKPKLAEFESPYEKAINLYKDAKQLLLDIGWTNEANRLDQTIAFYYEKKEKDEKLRKLQEEKEEYEITVGVPEKGVEVKAQKAYLEVQKQRQKEQKIYDQIFEIINNAENLAKEYHKNIEQDSILNHQSPYEKVISLYKEAKEKFQQVGWTREAEKLNESINYYTRKLEEDKILKQREKERIRRREQERLEQQKLMEQTQKEEEKLLKEQEESILREKEAKERYEQQKEHAFKIIDNALEIARNYNKKIQEDNILNYECPYEKVIDLYKEAKNIFQKIGWNNEADKMGQSINYYKQKLKEDQNLRNAEKLRLERQRKEQLEQQRIIEQARAEEKEILNLQEKAIEKERKEKEKFERKKDKAFELMDKAKKKLDKHNFDEAIQLYKETREIFRNIDWSAGIDLVEESINSIFREKRKYQKEKEDFEREKEKEMKLREELEQQIEKMEEIKKLEEEEKRQEFIRIQEEKRREKEITDKAFKLLEEGTNLVEMGEFDNAYQKYIEGRELFEKVDWQREVSRINTDLLYNLEKEREKAEKIKEAQKRKREEEEEMRELLKEKEKLREEQKRKEKEAKRRRFVERRRAEKPKEELMDKLELAKVLIRNYKYNEAYINLKQKIEELDDSKAQVEIQNIIDSVKEQANLPLIVSMAPDLIYKDKFKVAYEALDKAERSIKNKNYMKAISELNEAKFNISNVIVDDKIISAIENKISFYKQQLGHEIAETTKHEEVLEDLKSEIAKRRAERRKRLRKL